LTHIQWKERYNIDYKEVDAQHRRLLDILNQLLDLVQCKRPADEISIVFHRLCAYALDHFSLEEHYLEASGYPGLARQREDHAHFVGKILEFNERYDPADPAFLLETFEFLKTWYLQHILRTDTEYIPWVKRFHREARVQCILVDFEDLLCHEDPARFIAALAALSGRPEAFLERRLLGESLLEDYKAGALDQAGFAEELELPDLEDTTLAEAFAAMYAPATGLLDLLGELKPHYKLGLVANSHPWHAEQVVGACPVFHLFDAVSLSHRVKALVPDHRILNDALNQLGFMSEECLFLTGRADRAEAAGQWCYQVQVFRGATGVRSFLEKRGLG